MNRLIDLAKTNKKNNFLKHIYTIFSQNDLSDLDMKQKKNIVYIELCKMGLKQKDIGPNQTLLNVNYLFNYWLERNKLQGNNDFFVDPTWTNFIQIVDEKGIPFGENSKFIKLYIPIDQEHLYQGVNELFDFIRNSNIRHHSKVANELRSDNIVVRLDINDEKSAMKIINFVNSNSILKKGLNKTNPFVPTIKGIGYIHENGISYNGEMALMIAEYTDYCIKTGQQSNLNGFCRWIINTKNNSEAIPIFLSTLDLKISKKEEKKDINIFIDTLKATYLKYGIEHVIKAVLSVIKNNDYSYFTNGNVGLRDKLIKSMTSNQIKDYIDSVLYFKKYDVSQIPLDEKIKLFCYDLFNKNLILKFDEICITTLSNHNKDFLVEAINSYLKKGDALGFSRYLYGDKKVNYREEILKFSPQEVIHALKSSLILKGINTNDMSIDESIDIYAQTLFESIYKDKAEISKIAS